MLMGKYRLCRDSTRPKLVSFGSGRAKDADKFWLNPLS